MTILTTITELAIAISECVAVTAAAHIPQDAALLHFHHNRQQGPVISVNQ
jgi:hypothetical protein